MDAVSLRPGAVAFVTGGSGMVGRALVQRLASAGVRVLGLARGRVAAGAVEAAGAEPVFGDLARPEEWRDDVASADVVFHLGLPRLDPPVRAMGARARARAAEVGAAGLARVLDGQRVVAVSSGLVVGDRRDRGPAGETEQARPLALGRAALVTEHGLAGADARFVRLPWVYGDGGLARDLRESLRIGRFRVVGPGDNRWSLLGVPDAVEALVRAADAPPGVYQAAEPDPPTQLEVVHAVCRAVGCRRPDHLPPRLAALSLGGAVSEALAASLELRTDRMRATGWAPSGRWEVDMVSPMSTRGEG